MKHAIRSLIAVTAFAAAGLFGEAAHAQAVPQASAPNVTSAYPTPLPRATPIALRGVTVTSVPDFSRRKNDVASDPSAIAMNAGEAATVMYADPADQTRATMQLYAERTRDSQAWLASTVSTTVRLRAAAP